MYVLLAIWHTDQLGMSSILPCILFWKHHELTSLSNVILQDKPIQEEYETVTKILKTQRELLQVGDQEQLIPFTCIMNARTAIIQTILCGTLFCSKIIIKEETPQDNLLWPFYVPYGSIFCLTLKGAQHWQQTSQGNQLYFIIIQNPKVVSSLI